MKCSVKQSTWTRQRGTYLGQDMRLKKNPQSKLDSTYVPTSAQSTTRQGWWEGWSFSRVFECHEPMTVTGPLRWYFILLFIWTILSLSLLQPKESAIHSSCPREVSEVSGGPESYLAIIRSTGGYLLNQMIFGHAPYPRNHRSKGIPKRHQVGCQWSVDRVK